MPQRETREPGRARTISNLLQHRGINERNAASKVPQADAQTREAIKQMYGAMPEVSQALAKIVESAPTKRPD